jgi:site-specific DNA recombinase
MKTAAIYARVSSERQREEQTIASQTAALKEMAQAQGWMVPPQWVFEDDGYSGASLVRPGLERLRDLAAEGQIEAMLVYSPDRLSRKYAYQVLLIEELARCGVEVVFVRSPKAQTPEEHLLLQFQGMIAEYERAQIAERTRRGKRHRAKAGTVNVLSGAPYGYRYVPKSDRAEAYYHVLEPEAEVVQAVFRRYTQESVSINAIARELNERGVATRTGVAHWCRSTVWAMLRNPAYMGLACFGKTETVERRKITRPLRQRGGYSPRNSANRERPRDQWIGIPVPPLVSEETFALAQEKLEANKRFAPRRTIEPTLLQGMLVCQRCGYAYYRTSTRTSKRKLHYYRCLGSDDYRYPHGRVCENRPVRQDYLDALVWDNVLELLQDPRLIRAEIERRLEAIRNASPTKQRQDALRKESARLQNSIGRLLDAYQEELISLEELRHRMPPLRKRQQAVEAQRQALAEQVTDSQGYLRLADTLEAFLARLRAQAETLDVIEKQKILRLVVKEVLVGEDTITIKHAIPITGPSRGSDTGGGPETKSYLLRSGRHHPALRSPPLRMTHLAGVQAQKRGLSPIV